MWIKRGSPLGTYKSSIKATTPEGKLITTSGCIIGEICRACKACELRLEGSPLVKRLVINNRMFDSLPESASDLKKVLNDSAICHDLGWTLYELSAKLWAPEQITTKVV